MNLINNNITGIFHGACRLACTWLLTTGVTALLTGCATDVPENGTPGAAFESPEAAMRAVGDIAGSGDVGKIKQLFGEEGAELLRSGDPVADREDGLQAKAMLAEKLEFRDLPDGSKVALLGTDAWPFAIPLVKTPEGWRFDIEAGAEELANRRVGRNELQTIAALRACVDAQKEYRALAPDGRAPAYAQKFASSEGLRDGLYWPAGEGEPESPLGPLAAEAAGDGYRRQAGECTPFQGYYYRMLFGQGSYAPGGARPYVNGNGLMTDGFAILAWPARYNQSGVMTFIVNQRGIVFQKDLGEETESAAAAVTLFDPDKTWAPVDEP